MQTNIPGLQTTDPGVHTIDPGVQTMTHYELPQIFMTRLTKQSSVTNYHQIIKKPKKG